VLAQAVVQLAYVASAARGGERRWQKSVSARAVAGAALRAYKRAAVALLRTNNVIMEIRHYFQSLCSIIICGEEDWLDTKKRISLGHWDLVF
jgi:hypothetical protein